MSGIRLVEELRRAHDVAEYYAYSEWARMFQAAADRVEFLEAEVERIQAEADKDLDGHEDYIGRVDAQLRRSLKAIGEDASGFPDSIDMTCRILESVPRLKAEVERLTPKPMTLEEACDVLNSSQYSYCFTWEAQGPWSVEGSYVRAGLVDDCDECMVKLDLFEATALARAFLLKGAGPIAVREPRVMGEAKCNA